MLKMNLEFQCPDVMALSSFVSIIMAWQGGLTLTNQNPGSGNYLTQLAMVSSSAGDIPDAITNNLYGHSKKSQVQDTCMVDAQ